MMNSASAIAKSLMPHQMEIEGFLAGLGYGTIMTFLDYSYKPELSSDKFPSIKKFCSRRIFRLFLISSPLTNVIFSFFSRTKFSISSFEIGVVISLIAISGCSRISHVFKKSHSSQTTFSEPSSSDLVPDRWAEDLILKQFTCAINHHPTVKPVGDSEVKAALYDSSAVFSWWYKKRRSPYTGNEMLPGHYSSQHKYILEGLIHYRIAQLKDLEASLQCELSPDTNIEHKQSMQATAKELDSKIRPLLQKSIEETASQMHEIPPFLDGHGHFWVWRCSATGKPIRHAIFPKLDQSLLEKDSSLSDIFYEKAYIENLMTQPGLIPNQWPAQIPFVKDNLKEDPSATREINRLVIIALKELRQYYTSLKLS